MIAKNLTNILYLKDQSGTYHNHVHILGNTKQNNAYMHKHLNSHHNLFYCLLFYELIATMYLF